MDRTTRTAGFLSSLLAGLCLLQATPLAAQEGDGRIVDREKELPRGLAIVPWKKTSAEALEEGPVRLVEEPLQPIDPEVFRRKLELHSKPQALTNKP